MGKINQRFFRKKVSALRDIAGNMIEYSQIKIKIHPVK